MTTKTTGKKGSLLMMIIGCDFHPSWQQVAWLDIETGESAERKLLHASGEARQVLCWAEAGLDLVWVWSQQATAIGLQTC